MGIALQGRYLFPVFFVLAGLVIKYATAHLKLKVKAALVAHHHIFYSLAIPLSILSPLTPQCRIGFSVEKICAIVENEYGYRVKITLSL